MEKKRALVVLAEGFEDIEAVAPIDVLNRVGVEVVTASVVPGPVRAAYGTVIVPDTTVSAVQGEFDAIICPGGKRNAQSLAADPRVIALVQEFMSAGKLVCAICAAPSHVLGEAAQVLSGRRSAGDPGFNGKLAASGAVLTHEPVSVDGNLITGNGPGSALEFALTIAACLVSKEAARQWADKWGVSLRH